MPKNTSKICLTGGHGFVGSNLLKLLEQNHDLKVVLFEGDLLIKEDIEKFFQKNPGIEQIINLVGIFDGDFSDLLKINVVTLENLLSIAQKYKVKKIIQASTGAVYGEPLKSVYRESDPLHPNTYYGLSKMYAEQVIAYYQLVHALQAVVLRFPNIYSENQGRGVINAFLNGIKEHGEITVRGDGTQSRNFLHISDVCRAIELAVSCNQSDIFNISNPKKVSIDDLVEILHRKYKFTVKHLPSDNNLKDLLLDVSKAKSKLQFEPIVKMLNL